MSRSDTVPFHTFLWKIASRCNLDCGYCYVYNTADQRWRRQPKFMSEQVARQIAVRMREHFAAHDKQDCRIVFHGGEPLLGGVEHLEMVVSVIDEELRGHGIKAAIGMQSNGLLFTPEIGDLMLAAGGISMGVSLDGPPEVNDVYRYDHRRRPSTGKLAEKLALLTTERYRSLFAGILCVINPFVDPIAVTDYLLSFNPAMIDFLYPLDNHDRRPKGKELNMRAAPYGEWLIKSFDHWWALGKPCEIRIFDSILGLICGAPTLVESLGLDPVDLVVVETNGEVEGVDSLKSTFDGASALGYSVFEHDFDTVAGDMAVRRRQMGVQELCETCRRCPVVDICGGGYLPHRYSAKNGFDNPSAYCSDLEILIRHIHGTLFDAVRSERTMGRLQVQEMAL